MKKLTIIIISLLLLIFPAISGAAGSVVQRSVVDVGEDKLNSNSVKLVINTTYSSGQGFESQVDDTINFRLREDITVGSFASFFSDANIELTDTNGEQSWLYNEGKVAQIDTAAVNLFKGNLLVTTLGDGSTGDGNNLLNLQTDSVTKMRVDTTGRIVLAETAAVEGFVFVPPAWMAEKLAAIN